MSLESVKAFFATNAPDIQVIETTVSTATVALAAEAHGVAPGQIAKTLCIRVNDRVLLLVTRGDARLDNRKAKAAFGSRPRMLGPEAVEKYTGHKVGGVCPFGLPAPLPIFCDVSLKIYDEVIPAGGSTHASVRLTVDRLVELTKAEWAGACEVPETG
jgi:prolyl-tRNA editing enzyme YbaK/EbsC (Cys-tRNA(Pro) deacylase)